LCREGKTPNSPSIFNHTQVFFWKLNRPIESGRWASPVFREQNPEQPSTMHSYMAAIFNDQTFHF